MNSTRQTIRAICVAVAALAAAALVWWLGTRSGLSGGGALLLATLLAAALIYVAVLTPLVTDLSRRLGSVEYEIADTVQRLRVAKAAQPASTLTDEVTMLPSRRAVTSSILEHMGHAERYGNPLSIAYVELNDFERLHSEFGTGVTDQALKTVADAFADTLRMPDKAGRCDGHTFLVVLPHTTLKDANGIAERLRRNGRVGQASGPFVMAPGDTQEVVVAEIVAGAIPGVDRLSAISLLKFYDQIAQVAYDNFFDSPTPPLPAPEVTVVALDKKIVLDWGENPVSVQTTESSNSKGYLFEGYNVYQLPNESASISAGARIATYDLSNGIGKISDLVFDPNTGSVVLLPVQ